MTQAVFLSFSFCFPRIRKYTHTYIRNFLKNHVISAFDRNLAVITQWGINVCERYRNISNLLYWDYLKFAPFDATSTKWSVSCTFARR
jgi:hypothetical protein